MRAFFASLMDETMMQKIQSLGGLKTIDSERCLMKTVFGRKSREHFQKLVMRQ
jgi:hypothetical protein